VLRNRSIRPSPAVGQFTDGFGVRSECWLAVWAVDTICESGWDTQTHGCIAASAIVNGYTNITALQHRLSYYTCASIGECADDSGMVEGPSNSAIIEFALTAALVVDGVRGLRSAKPSETLNIGSGSNPRPGAVNVDVAPGNGVNVQGSVVISRSETGCSLRCRR
jgi:hypothetical protein